MSQNQLQGLPLKPNLTTEQKRHALIILQEMQTRGMKIPKIEKASLTDNWGVDENGYFVRDDGKHYNPAPSHLAFIRSNSLYTAVYGRRGCGKTSAGVQKALLRVKLGLSGAVVNPDLENFRLSTWPEMKRWIPWNMVVPRQRYRASPDWDVTRPFSLVFINGAIMYCKGLKDPNSARGPNLNWLWYDEAGRDKTGLGWQLAIAGVRIGKDPQAWATYTPKAFDHWTYKFFIEQEFSDEVLDLLNKFREKSDRTLIEWFHATKQDNEENLDAGFSLGMAAANPVGYLKINEVDGDYAPEEGTLGDRRWFNGQYLDSSPDWVDKWIRYWDLAASEKKVGTDPDETVGSLVGTDKPRDRFCIGAQIGGFWTWDVIKENMKQIAIQDGPGIAIYIEQEPASGGKNQVAELKNYLAQFGFKVKGHNPKDDGDRVLAAETWFGEAAIKKWFIVKGGWNEKFLSQLDTFPEGNHDDRITSVTGARHSIAPIRKWSKVEFRHLNQTMSDEDKKRLLERRAEKALGDYSQEPRPGFMSLHPSPQEQKK